MPASPPPYVVRAVEAAAPGFVAWWNAALPWAYQRSGPWTVTSWWRSPEHNRSVGGVDDSQHLIGTAFDVIERPRIAEALRAAGFVVVREPDHLHVQAWPAGYASRVLRGLGW